MILLLFAQVNVDNLSQYLEKEKARVQVVRMEKQEELQKAKYGRVKRNLRTSHDVRLGKHYFKTPELKEEYVKKLEEELETIKVSLPLLDLNKECEVGDIGSFKPEQKGIHYRLITHPEGLPADCVIVEYRVGMITVIKQRYGGYSVRDDTTNVFTFILKDEKSAKDYQPIDLDSTAFLYKEAKIEGKVGQIIGTWNGQVTGTIYIVKLIDIEGL